MALFSKILSRGYTALISRNFHGSSAVRNDELKKMMFYGDGYYKMGLYHDDTLDENNPVIAEAVRRLTDDMAMQRKYRAIRAQQAELNNSLLPKDQWTTFDDKNQYYLQPYIQEVLAEIKEREEWEATH